TSNEPAEQAEASEQPETRAPASPAPEETARPAAVADTALAAQERATPPPEAREDTAEETPLAEEVYTLDDVVVTGARGERRREDAVVITEVIAREEIESYGARTLTDILATHPGIDVTREIGADA